MGHLRCEGGIGVPFLLTNIENDWGPKANADQSGGHWTVWPEGSWTRGSHSERKQSLYLVAKAWAFQVLFCLREPAVPAVQRTAEVDARHLTRSCQVQTYEGNT